MMRIGYKTNLKKCWIGIGLLYGNIIIINLVRNAFFLFKDIKYNI